MSCVFDIHSTILPLIALASQTIATTANGTGIDTVDCDAVEFLFNFGATVEAGTTIKLQESANNTDWADVSDPGYSGGSLNYGVLQDSALAPAANSVIGLGYVGNERYVRAVVVTTGSTLVSVTAIKGRLHETPGQLVDKVPPYTNTDPA